MTACHAIEPATNSALKFGAHYILCVKGVSSTWNDSQVVGLAVVPKSTADSASGNQHVAHLHGNVLVVTERV